MICPFCKTDKPGVAKTIWWLDDLVPRTRTCSVCRYSFSTTERIDTDEDFRERKAAYERDNTAAQTDT